MKYIIPIKQKINQGYHPQLLAYSPFKKEVDKLKAILKIGVVLVLSSLFFQGFQAYAGGDDSSSSTSNNNSESINGGLIFEESEETTPTSHTSLDEVVNTDTDAGDRPVQTEASPNKTNTTDLTAQSQHSTSDKPATAVRTPLKKQHYAKASVGRALMKVNDFSFHNPIGAGVTDNSTSGNYILMDGVDDSDSAMALSLAVGTQFKDTPFRGELNLTHRSDADFKGSASFGGVGFHQDLTVASNSLMLYGFYDFELDSQSSLFAGLGFGLAQNRVSASQGANLGAGSSFPSKTNNEFAWGLSFGYSRQLDQLADGVLFDITYQFVHLGNADTNTTDNSILGMNPNERLESELTSQEISFGLRFPF